MTIQAMTSVGIIGCGWLGSALAHQLIAQNIKVVATRSTDENVELLKIQGIGAEVLLLPSEQKLLETHAVFKTQCLVIAITPQFKQGRVDYGNKVQQLVLAAKESSYVEQVILLSSTAIYNGLAGNIEESSLLDLTADKVAVLNQAEQAVLKFSDMCTGKGQSKGSSIKASYVLRLAGLVGPNRHPGKFLLNGRTLKGGDAKTNLIHQQDVIGLILVLLTKKVATGIYNGVSATHVSKKEYYQSAAKALGIAPPHFEKEIDEIKAKIRIINGDKVTRQLAYPFSYPDLLTWLSQE